MSEKNIKTKTVGRNVATSNPIKLSESPDTKVGFIPTLITGRGVRGKLVKYKKNRSKEWEELKEADFESHSLSTMQKITVDLNLEATTLFLNELGALKTIAKQGIENGETDYVVGKASNTIIIDDQNKHSILNQILEKGLSAEFWDLMAGDKPALADRLAKGRIQQIRAEVVSELKERLTKDYPETKGPDCWQKWILKNHWLFGVNYKKPIEQKKINLDGVMPDYLFPRIDGFIDLLEIKLPKHPVIKSDPSHRGSYVWTPETTKAIGQVAFYLSEINRLQLEIEKKILETVYYKVSMLKPRAYILIGNSEGWSDQEHEGLRRLNDALHGIEVLTYQELVQRGNAFLASPHAVDSKIAEEVEIPF